MTDRKKVVEDLRLLKEKGVEIAIDDFGVGYSSLSYLQQLKIDIIKIDKSFVQQLGIDSAGTILCKTIVQMAKNLNIKVVAEGIEDEAQLQMLTEFGCHFGQGYFIAKPAQAKKFETFFHAFKPAHIASKTALKGEVLL
jgi:EAL domain-containing protein (putative c-di-GMP-specific phosphodiesterase class I)